MLLKLHFDRLDPMTTSRSPQFLIYRNFKRRSILPLNPETIWLIDSGVVRTLTWFEDGSCATLGLWGEGDLVGSALSASRAYEIECLTDVRAKVIPKAQWYLHTEAMILHIQKNEEFLKIVHCRQAEIAIMHLLNWLVKRFGSQVEQGELINLRLTHQEMAEMIGTTRVTMTRILNNFERQGLIQRQQHLLILMSDRQEFWHYEI